MNFGSKIQIALHARFGKNQLIIKTNVSTIWQKSYDLRLFLVIFSHCDTTFKAFFTSWSAHLSTCSGNPFSSQS